MIEFLENLAQRERFNRNLYKVGSLSRVLNKEFNSIKGKVLNTKEGSLVK